MKEWKLVDDASTAPSRAEFDALRSLVETMSMRVNVQSRTIDTLIARIDQTDTVTLELVDFSLRLDRRLALLMPPEGASVLTGLVSEGPCQCNLCTATRKRNQ